MPTYATCRPMRPVNLWKKLTQNEEHKFRNWSPLPNNLVPVGAIPILNLLGYRTKVERLNAEGVQVISDMAFPNLDNMSSRIKWCPELVVRVNDILKKMEPFHKMVNRRHKPGTNSSVVR